MLEIVRHNMSALQALLAWVAARPPLERLLRIESGVLPAYTHELAAGCTANRRCAKWLRAALPGPGQ
jgi:UV DNA damage endonuclease